MRGGAPGRTVTTVAPDDTNSAHRIPSVVDARFLPRPACSPPTSLPRLAVLFAPLALTSPLPPYPGRSLSLRTASSRRRRCSSRRPRCRPATSATLSRRSGAGSATRTTSSAAARARASVCCASSRRARSARCSRRSSTAPSRRTARTSRRSLSSSSVVSIPARRGVRDAQSRRRVGVELPSLRLYAPRIVTNRHGAKRIATDSSSVLFSFVRTRAGGVSRGGC